MDLTPTNTRSNSGREPAGSRVFSAVTGALMAIIIGLSACETNAGGNNFCPAYSESDLYRTRANQVTVTPSDPDWEATLMGVAPNTEILLADGEYRFTRPGVWLPQADLTIRSASGNRDAVVLRGEGYGVRGEGLMLAGPRATVADLTILDLRDHAISIKAATGGIESQTYNVKILDIGTQHIKGSAGGRNTNGLVACSELGYNPGAVQGDYIGAIDIHEAVDWTIRDNFIFNITGDGTGCQVDFDCGRYVTGPAITLWNNSSGGVLERNTIVDSFRGITLGLGTPHDGGVVRNNFIYQTQPGDAGIELWNASNVTVEHNTVLLDGYPGAIEFGGAPNLVVRNNLISAPPLDRSANRGASPGVVMEGNITDATTSDLVAPDDPHLPAGSRAIGAGVFSSATTTDIDGEPRNGRWDVGADQDPG